ncbi:DNA excision repair protein ERCC-4 [Cryptococcus deuterogattii 99/473]|uniref:DNA excision repair protein ERCC-4 n=1 Tax=Cryptococcus deuterogattii Ram5 TaxID=1296110 RepID=A0A0D0TW94_9TREE|nr:DNA excision repair protein ERCC-4 [Cryptococcus deuterogattii LA55]KIR40083.1 DNA excision repair protein ERCC-4 [Cryptococcus deuterogattii Ram5]KIR91057.1 DNA excision repair protein ERCC-4 [Cryptococcus deuterogattii CBS 10090]KIR96480.1 DNA excision repair protein ERCC-4 [Cryptococcus deuterogattii 2001/935-1]KIY55878.1 DNA excision repair protein ERCC-4 [Cryptococcus deuterogattii 99/473]
MFSKSRRHIPYLPFHKNLIRTLCRPQQDDLLLIAKGLGLRRIVCALLKTYDRKEDLVLVVGATPADEAGIGDELGIMGVRDPGFRVVGYEMSVKERNEMYRHGGLFSVTSKILVNDLLKGTLPVKLITGLVILHAERISHGSQEEFASGFCKAFSDEPEVFAHGMSPLRDMLINLNMTSVLIWPRFNEVVKVDLSSRRADVVEMYVPMTDLMRQCQDAITECMEAMLVELKRDHSLNLDLEDINVRNAQFKNFDTIVRMRLKPVWHKVGAKTKIHVAALTELRNLHTWLLEYDSATFASYINTLQRQHFQAEKLITGAGRHIHDWFNAKAASQLVEASQARVSRRKMVMDNSPGPEEDADRRDADVGRDDGVDFQEEEFGLEEEALREQEELAERQRRGITEIVPDDDEEEIMEIFATQTQTLPQHRRPEDANNDLEQESMTQDENADETLRSAEGVLPPVFRPVMLSVRDDLGRSVERRLKKGHEAVLEEQPKWSVLAKVLKEIEDTIATVQVSHADAPGTNIILVMTTSDRTCLQLRQYLTTMSRTDPPFGPQAGRKMMESLFLSNWQHEKNGEKLGNAGTGIHRSDNDEIRVRGDIESKRVEDQRRAERARGRGRGVPSYKRRRQRGGAAVPAPRLAEMEKEHKEAMMKAYSAFTGGENDEDTQMQWALGESTRSASFTDLSTTSTSSDPSSALLASTGILEEDDLQPAPGSQTIAEAQYGLLPENFEEAYGLIAPEDAVIIRPYGGEDDDILLQELRPRFVVMYEPNLPFIRRLEVYRNCNPGLSLRVYQMIYTNSFEEDRFLSTIQREAEAFKKLIDDRQSMVIPIYNNNPRAPMRDTVTRSKTTYSSRNAGGGESAEEARIIVDIREMGALLPSLIDSAGIKVIPSTLTVGDYILSPKIHTQCEAMTSHYETCVLLIEFDEDKFGMRTKEDARREAAGRANDPDETWRDTFYLQSKLALLALHFPRLRIIWSSSPHESVKILSDLKLNHDEPDEITATLKGSSEGEQGMRSGIENAAAVEMLRSIPGVSGRNLKFVMSKVESIKELVSMSRGQLKEILGEEGGEKAWEFLHHDPRYSR